MRRVPRLILTLIVGLLPACTAPPAVESPDLESVRVVDRRIVMGVEATITTWADSTEVGLEATRGAFERMAALEAAISDYQPRSEAMQAVERVDEVVAISPDFAAALQASERWWSWSRGAFDPTIGPLTCLWREARHAGRVPSAASIDFASATVGWKKLVLGNQVGSPTVRFRTAAMRLDFGGIGKGLAADLGLEAMKAAGLPRTLVELGGDLVVGDPPPDADGWSIEIRTVAWDSGKRFILADAAVATSGDVHQYIEVVEDGATIRMGHLLDPRTGRPVRVRRQATVVVRGGFGSGADADALASIAVVVGARGLESFASDLARDATIRVVEAIVPVAEDAVSDHWTIRTVGLGAGSLGE